MFKGRSFLVKMVKDGDGGNPEEVDLTQEAKSHFERNKAAYISGGVFFIAGVTYLATRGHYAGGLQSATEGSTRITVSPLSLFSNRMTNNTVITTLERRGHPGWIVKCKETGELFASQNRAAEANGIDPSIMSRHLNGVFENAQGKHFERIGEAI